MFKNLTFKVQKFKVQCFGRKGLQANSLTVLQACRQTDLPFDF